jgi:autocrine motility factor receptor
MNQFRRRWLAFQQYRQSALSIETKYPNVSPDELKSSHDALCAICRENMESAKKLPCGHLFHLLCLRPWLEQHGSCPICRYPLMTKRRGFSLHVNNRQFVNRIEERTNQQGTSEAIPPYSLRSLRHVPYMDWLSNISTMDTTSRRQINPTDVSPISEADGPNHHHSSTSGNNDSILTMAQQIQSIFPDIPHGWILEDLTQTQSIPRTVENILEGRIHPIEPSSLMNTRNQHKKEKFYLWKIPTSSTGVGLDESNNGQPIRTLSALRRCKSEVNLRLTP